MMDQWKFDASSLIRLAVVYISLSSVAALSSSIEASTNTAWPANTIASGSTTHGEVDDQGSPRQYFASYTIDRRTDTYWNDDTQGDYPDVLTITTPSVVTLGGLIVLSNDNGFPLDYIVETYYNQEWTTASSIINSDNPLRYITFPPRKATQVRITVTRDQITKFLEYTRINEVYPLFANLPSTVSTPSTPCPASASLTPCPKPKNSHAGAIAGAVVGGVLGLVIAGLAVCILLKRRKQPVEIPPVETPPENIVHDVPKNTGMQELDGTRMARFAEMGDSARRYPPK